MDLISELPEPMLQHILSFLPIKQIVQTSVLSKRWNHVWLTFPVLEFDRKFFESNLPSNFNRKETKEIKGRRQELINFVEQTLTSCLSQMIGLKKFKLHMDFPEPKSATIVDRWIDYVLESNVRELEIVVTVENDRRYILPKRIFANQSFTVLTLGDCKLSPPPDDIKLLSMKMLSLLGVFASDEIIQNLVSKCPLIEHISLNSCRGLRSLCLSSAPELRTMEVENNSGLCELDIEAVNLQSFDFRGQYKPCCINISLCKNLKTLRLSMVAITDDWLHDCVSKLPLLEMLALTDCHMLENLRISSPHLKKFLLCECESLIKLKVDTPCLSAFKFCGDTISFSLNAPALLQADIELRPQILDNTWNAKQIEFLAHFTHLKVLTLQSMTGKTVIIPEELRETFPSPLYGVKHLKLKILKPLFGPAIQDLVNALLWMAPQPETISMESGFGKKILKFVYEKPRHGGGLHPCCCTSLPITCWRHCLKQLKLENIREDEERKELIKFFSENAKSLHLQIDDMAYLESHITYST